MKNKFFKKDNAAKTIKVTPPKSNMNLPFSQPMNQNNDDEHSKSSEDKKTRIGRQPEMPFKGMDSKDSLSCPKCQYPLRIEPSASSPCPNCGFGGSEESHDTVSDSKKTISLSSLDLKDEQQLSAFRFKMISESTGSEFKIESEESEIILNRDHLDPDNKTISSKEHLLLKFRDGKIYVEDVSTNGSTFIQVINKMPINPGIRIVMGNRIFLFSSGSSAPDTDDSRATRQLNMLDMDKENTNDCMLIEESSGRRINLKMGLNLLNRNNLDPGNASISGNKHASIECEDGEWSITDLSSNAATFIQCKAEQQMIDKIRIIIGNIIFRFEYD